MYPLTKLYARKIYRQKLIYIFFACFFIASFFYAFLISTPQMEEMLNINIGYSSNIALLQKIWVGYYLNLWTFAYEYQRIPFSEVLIGISIMILYGIIFFQISLYRTKKIDF